jgi:hypothetical protein
MAAPSRAGSASGPGGTAAGVQATPARDGGAFIISLGIGPGCELLFDGWSLFMLVGQAFPSILFIFVPQTGQAPLAIRRPFVSMASPSKSRFSLHFTQYPVVALGHRFSPFVHSRGRQHAGRIGAHRTR